MYMYSNRYSTVMSVTFHLNSFPSFPLLETLAKIDTQPDVTHDTN